MKLLTPIQVGPMEIKNRVVSTAHAAYLDYFRPDSDGERYIAYQERRAKGGAGMVIMTAMHVHESSGLINHFVFDEYEMPRKLKMLADRVHHYGTKVISQLFHFGVQATSASRSDLQPLWGFSGTTSLEGEPSHQMTDGEIEEVIDAFCRAATVVVESGIDGVELHGTHGYLIAQSMSPFANQRTDKWGEPLFFIHELARRVRGAIGREKILGFRISADDFISQDEGGLGHQRLCAIAHELTATGLFDYLNHSEGSGGAHYARAVGSYRHKLGEYLPLTRGLAEAIERRIPVIGVGKIPTPDLAEQALLDGDCDMVGMTRAQIADPDLVQKLIDGRMNEIRICTGANQGCIDRHLYGITCIQNPEVGEERRFQSLGRMPVEQKKVLVIGGGPAGMKAAEIAAERGHEVTLADRGSALGGRFLLLDRAREANNLTAVLSSIEAALDRHKVKVDLGVVVDGAYIADLAPDAIILATGADPSSKIGCATDDSVPVISSDEAMMGELEGTRFNMADARIVMVDVRANYETAVVLETLIDRGAHVTLVTPHLQFGANLGFTHLNDLLPIVYGPRVSLQCATTLAGVSDGHAVLRHAYSGEEIKRSCDIIISGASPVANDALLITCQEHAPTKMVGDAVAARSALEAIREGDRAGRTV